MNPSSILLRTGLAAGLLLAASNAPAATYRVPGDAATIQQALNLTQPGDSVIVGPGTYPENLTMRSGVDLLSDLGPGVTTVDARFIGPVVVCRNISNFTITGFTLRRGSNNSYPGGGGITMDSSDGSIFNCVFFDNRSDRDGGGIALGDSRATIRQCTFRENSSYVAGFLDGGGLFFYRSTVVIEDCFFVDNLGHEGGAIAGGLSPSVIIRRSIFANNEATGTAGGAIGFASSTVQMENNTFVGNITPFAGACIYFHSASDVRIERNIVANATGVGIACQGGAHFIQCNDLWNNQNTNYQGCQPDPVNISADPLFCDLAHLDLRLSESSPCAPAHSPPGCGLIGALDVGCGPVAVEPATWGQVKARYGRTTAKESSAKAIEN